MCECEDKNCWTSIVHGTIFRGTQTAEVIHLNSGEGSWKRDLRIYDNQNSVCSSNVWDGILSICVRNSLRVLKYRDKDSWEEKL